RRVPHVEPVVVNERGLVAQPLIPAVLTNRGEDPLTKRISERRFGQLRSNLTATDARNIRHYVLLFLCSTAPVVPRTAREALNNSGPGLCTERPLLSYALECITGC